jgi:hypothetical protein
MSYKEFMFDVIVSVLSQTISNAIILYLNYLANC